MIIVCQLLVLLLPVGTSSPLDLLFPQPEPEFSLVQFASSVYSNAFDVIRDYLFPKKTFTERLMEDPLGEMRRIKATVTGYTWTTLMGWWKTQEPEFSVTQFALDMYLDVYDVIHDKFYPKKTFMERLMEDPVDEMKHIPGVVAEYTWAAVFGGWERIGERRTAKYGRMVTNEVQELYGPIYLTLIVLSLLIFVLAVKEVIDLRNMPTTFYNQEIQTDPYSTTAGCQTSVKWTRAELRKQYPIDELKRECVSIYEDFMSRKQNVADLANEKLYLKYQNKLLDDKISKKMEERRKLEGAIAKLEEEEKNRLKYKPVKLAFSKQEKDILPAIQKVKKQGLVSCI